MKNILTRLAMLLTVICATSIFAPNIYSQQQQVHGVVTDNDGISLPGVNIIIKGTTTGVITDMGGNYTIQVGSSQVLLFSFLGFTPVEVLVGSQTEINIQLIPSSEKIEEVLVIGYGQQKKVTVTGAISAIGSDELIKSPSASIANSLAGKVTGLSTVQFSGQPGADDPTIYVRGIATLFEDRAEPLMIVDGIERSFMQLDPNEISSISVLKDASATAVYGVKGANGVIIVTTKRGSEGPAKISVNYSTGIQAPNSLLDFTDSYTYAMMFNEAQLNDDPLLSPEQLKFSPEALEAFRTGSDPLIYPDIDWMDYMMKPFALQKNGNVNISGGTKKIKYFVALGYLMQDGLFETFDSQYDYNFSYNRYNYRSNLDIDLTNTTKVGITIGGRVGIKNQPNASSNMDQAFRNISWSVPYSGAGIIDGKYIRSGDYYISGEKKDGLTEFYGRGFQNQTTNDLNFDIDLSQDLSSLVEGLSFRTKYSYNSFYLHKKTRGSSVARYEPYFLKDLDPTADATDRTIVYRKNGSDGNLSYNEGTGKGRNYYLEAGLDYSKSFGNHNITGLLLYNQKKIFYPLQFSEIPNSLVGFAGRLTYNYRTKYLFDFNLGYNGSENFAENLRFGLFPAASAGWIVTEESFMPKTPILSYLKLRVSYGLVGNDKIGPYRFLYLPDSYDTSSGGYNFGTNVPSNQPGASESKLGNPLVTWETAKKQNYGVDMKLFNGKLAINYDLFRERRSDILTFKQTVPGILAIDLPPVNIGAVENKGFEIQVAWRNKISQKFSYWVNVNMSHAKNEIIFMDEIPQPEDYLYKTGHPVNQFFGYVFDGFYELADSLTTADHLYDLKPGDMTYKDLNNDGLVNEVDQKAIGYTVYPQNSYGANIGFQFKGFDFAMYWVGASHTSRMLDESYRVAFGNTLDRSLLQYMADGRWTPETGDQATYPRMTLSGSLNNKKDSDFWLRDASYIRLKNVEIGYNFQGNILNRIGVKTLRTYVNGYNLITLDRLGIADPEARSGRSLDYPLVKIYNIGVKLTF